MNQELIFRTEKVSEHITRIFAFSTEMMYLVEGSERAALIDTGSGIGSLKACVDQLTDKPVIVLLTHGHVDHAMGAAEFDEVYMNRRDDYIFHDHGKMEFRIDGLSMLEPAYQAKATAEDIIPTADVNTFHDLREGDRFDLGGVSVEIYDCPGHTKGSVVMLIPEDRLLMTGDACNTFTFVFDYYSTSISEYEESLRTLLPKVHGRYDSTLLSHGDGIGYQNIIEDVIQVCEDIKAGNTDDQPFSFSGTQACIAKAVDFAKGPERRGNVVYSKDRIWKRADI